MKKLIFSLAMILLSISYLYGQSWSSEVQLNFLVQSNTKVASFVDANGVHIAYSRNGGIKYALVNSDGGVVKYDKTIESESSNCEFANIVSENNNLYVFYIKNNNINVAKSSNLGDSWNTSFSNRLLINTGINHLVAHQVGQFTHIVWAEEKVGSSYTDDSHYIRFNPNAQPNPIWDHYQNVTAVETDGGLTPDVAVSTDRIHVNYIEYGFDEPRTRDRLSSGWQTPQSVPFYSFPFVTNIVYTKPFITDDDLDIIYYATFSTIGTSGAYIAHSYREIDGSTWTKDPTYFSIDDNYLEVVSDKTSDNKLHILYYDDLEDDYVHRYVTGTNWSSVVANIPLSSQSNSLSPNSNDLYLLTVYNPDLPSKIRYHHFDAAPLTPTNFSGLFYNNHPKLIWNLNNEPDIDGYEIYRLITGGSGVYELLTTVSSGTSSYVDNGVQLGGRSMGKVFYKIRAKDNNPNYSAYTNVIIYSYSGLNKLSFVNNSVEYKLFSNYPNPFNPSTQIRYSLAQDAIVGLKVYDMLGTEVAELVSETQIAGNHTISFNAKDLSSGVYIYRITAANNGRILFTDSKQMLFMK